MSNSLEKLLAEDAELNKAKQEAQATEQKQEDNKQEQAEDTTSQEQTQASENKSEETQVESTPPSSLKETESESKNTEQSVDDFDQRFKARLKEEGYISKNELEELSNKPVTKNELLQKLLEYDKNGVNIDRKTLTELLEDFDSYNYKKSSDALNLMRRKLRRELGDDELVEFKLKKAYSALFDEDQDTDEYREALLELQIDAKTALSEFKAEQEKLSIPDPSKKNVDVEQALKEFQEKEAAAQREKMEQIQEGFNKLSEMATKDFNEVDYKVLGEDVKVEVTAEQKRELKKELKNLSTFFDRHFMKDNEIDYKGLSEFMFLALNKDKITEIIAGNFKSKGQEEEFSSIKNTTQSGSTRRGDKPADDFYSQIAQQFAKEQKKIW